MSLLPEISAHCSCITNIYIYTGVDIILMKQQNKSIAGSPHIAFACSICIYDFFNNKYPILFFYTDSCPISIVFLSRSILSNGHSTIAMINNCGCDTKSLNLTVWR